MTIQTLLAKSPIIPVVTLHNEKDAEPLAKALIAGGLNAMQIMLRTNVAFSCVEIIRRAYPDLIVGVGNVLEQEQLHTAKKVGAMFAASPGFAAELLQLASVLELPYVPGVMTVSEMMQVRELDVKVLGFFPAQAAGGDNFLRAMLAVFSDLKFIASGGIHAQNLQHYLILQNVLAVGGTWLAPADLIAAKDWDAITELAAFTLSRLQLVNNSTN